MSSRSITVYCSSTQAVALHFHAAAVELGRAIVANNWQLVYGGNSVGVMKSIADSVRANNGKVIGVTPQYFVDEGCVDQDCHELLITQTMRERKHLLEQRGDAFIAMPGGLGTFEEIFEIIVGRSLGFHAKPIVLLNVANYWNPMLDMIERGIEQNFIKPRARGLYFVAAEVEHAIAHLNQSFATQK